MPLILEGGGVPGRWPPGESRSFEGRHLRINGQAECVRIALINNMPDPALEDTETQFFDLLATAAGDLAVHVQLYSLPEIARGDRARQHMNGFYGDLRAISSTRVDALIITGTEPHEADLRKESYWGTLVDLLDWAEHHTVSTILSCLAAHASVLHSDGIARHLLSDKRFGVFNEQKVSQHFLISGTADIIRIPHSRWNEVREDDLVSSGYTVLTRSQDAGVGLFAKQRRNSLFVYSQGHPEYQAQTFLKEYRRDVKRFLRKERTTYPSMPCGYFDGPATKLLVDFRERALADPREDVLTFFPDVAVAATLQNGWHSTGTYVYRNWLQYVVSRKAITPAFAKMAQVARA